MTRLTLMIFKAQLSRWLISLCLCGVLFGVTSLSEHMFNVYFALKRSLMPAPHMAIIWGISQSRRGACSLSKACASVGLPSWSWWGPMCSVWALSVALNFALELRWSAEGEVSAQEGQVWACEWSPVEGLPAKRARGACFMEVDGTLTVWERGSELTPAQIKVEALSAPPPEIKRDPWWRPALWRASLRVLLLTLLLSALLSTPRRYIGPLSSIAYALSWLWEYSLRA